MMIGQQLDVVPLFGSNVLIHKCQLLWTNKPWYQGFVPQPIDELCGNLFSPKAAEFANGTGVRTPRRLMDPASSYAYKLYIYILDISETAKIISR